MQYGMRHLIGATLIVTLFAFSHLCSAQDGPNNVSKSYQGDVSHEGDTTYESGYEGGTTYEGDTYDEDGTFDEGGTFDEDGAYDEDGACSSCAGEGCGNCSAPTSPLCRGKACNGHRPYTEASQPDLFYNFYVPNNMGTAAAAYPAPYPTPSLIGHTYYTYQPLMPHEFLYTHRRTYRQYYNGGMGLNRTTVRWYRTPVRTALGNVKGSVGWFLGNLYH